MKGPGDKDFDKMGFPNPMQPDSTSRSVDSVLVNSKGGKEALVPFGMEAGKALSHYLHFARQKLSGSRGGAPTLSPERTEREEGKEFLFLSKNGHRLTLQNLIDLMRRYVRTAGLPLTLSPMPFGNPFLSNLPHYSSIAPC